MCWDIFHARLHWTSNPFQSSLYDRNDRISLLGDVLLETAMQNLGEKNVQVRKWMYIILGARMHGRRVKRILKAFYNTGDHGWPSCVLFFVVKKVWTNRSMIRISTLLCLTFSYKSWMCVYQCGWKLKTVDDQLRECCKEFSPVCKPWTTVFFSPHIWDYTYTFWYIQCRDVVHKHTGTQWE